MLPRLWDHLPDATVEAIRTTPKTGWIPVEKDRHLARAWGELFGPEKGKALVKGTVLTILDSPLYAPLIRPGLRLLGADPGTFVKIFPRAFSLTYRNVCTPVLGQRDRHRAELHFTDMSAPFFDAVDDYDLVFRAIFEAFFEIAEQEGGEVTWDFDPPGKRGTWTLVW